MTGTGRTTVVCPACQEPIELTWTLHSTGETAPSAEQPNAEGGTRDAVYDMRLDMGPSCGACGDPVPCWDYLRALEAELES